MAVRVLVVEDESLIREILVDVLRETGFEVIQAGNGAEALYCCRRQRIDVLITDIVMPGTLDGWRLAERCRAEQPDIGVIYATGFSRVEARPVPESLSVGKPYRSAEIVLVVRQLVGRIT